MRRAPGVRPARACAASTCREALRRVDKGAAIGGRVERAVAVAAPDSAVLNSDSSSGVPESLEFTESDLAKRSRSPRLPRPSRTG